MVKRSVRDAMQRDLVLAYAKRSKDVKKKRQLGVAQRTRKKKEEREREQQQSAVEFGVVVVLVVAVAAVCCAVAFVDVLTYWRRAVIQPLSLSSVVFLRIAVV